MNSKSIILIEMSKKGYKVNFKGELISPRGKILKCYNSRGYATRSFSIKNKGIILKRNIPLHRLMGYQKFGYKIFENGMVIRHLNGNSLDNSYKNIGIGTLSDNRNDIPKEIRLRNSLNASKKSIFYTRKFSDLEISNIRLFYNSCKSYKKTMKEYQISSKGSLHHILKNKYISLK